MSSWDWSHNHGQLRATRRRVGDSAAVAASVERRQWGSALFEWVRSLNPGWVGLNPCRVRLAGPSWAGDEVSAQGPNINVFLSIFQTFYGFANPL
jgi:hypothetical protein